MEKTNLVNENSSEVTKSYIILTIIAGILTLIPISSLLLGLIDFNMNINESVYIISFYIVKIIGYFIYFSALKNTTKSKITLSVVAGISLAMSAFMYYQMYNMENTGIDYVGEAILKAMVFNICMAIYYISTFILFIIYAKKFIFKKKAIVIIITAIILIILFVFIRHYSQIEKVSDNIPTVSDLKNELIERDLYTNDYLLFGIDNKENNIHKIDFNSDLSKKYPSYVYYGYKSKNLNKNINKYDDYLEWLIYYTNGKIYAVPVEFDDSQSFQDFYSLSLIPGCNIISEDKEMYTYNWEANYYEKMNNGGFLREYLRYYYDNDMYINVDVLRKEPYSYLDYEIIDKINSDTLDNLT